jgi:multidrug resistance efflux pump
MDDPFKNIKLRSEDINDILSQVPSKLIRWGSFMFLALIILLLCLSWLIKYPDVITTKAYVTTVNPPQKVYAKVTARIDAILVSNNQKVIKNEVLAILENNSNNQDVLFLKSIIDTITFSQNQVVFPFDRLPILLLGDLETPYSNFENSYYKYILNRDFKPHSNKITANKFSLIEGRNRINNLVEQQKLKNKELDFIKTDLDRHEQLLKKGVISQQTFEKKQIDYYASLRDYQNTNQIISQLRQLLSDSKTATKDIQFDMLRDETQLLKQVLHTFNQLKKAILDWELKYVLKSNIQGRVSFLEFWDTNQTVVKDDLVFTISPAISTHYVAKLKTPKSNAGKIKKGQLVNLKLDDFPDYEFGVIRGHVDHISNISDDKGTYIVDVIIPKELKTSYNKHIEFKQEMQGSADIITEDLRLLERFFYQFRNLYSR